MEDVEVVADYFRGGVSNTTTAAACRTDGRADVSCVDASCVYSGFTVSPISCSGKIRGYYREGVISINT
jgi:hypothetical protein